MITRLIRRPFGLIILGPDGSSSRALAGEGQTMRSVLVVLCLVMGSVALDAGSSQALDSCAVNGD